MEATITVIPASGEGTIEGLVQLSKEFLDFLTVAGAPPPPRSLFKGGIEIVLAPAVCAALGAFLASRNGRKVRLKIGDIETEAQTKEQVEELLALAERKEQERQQRNQPPKIIP